MALNTAETNEAGLLERALAALHTEAGIGHGRVKLGAQYARAGRRIDGHVWLNQPLGRYAFELKRHVAAAQVGVVAAQVRELADGEPMLLVTEYVNPQLADKLKARDIQFIDAAGNAYLHRDKPRVHIWVTGRKLQDVPRHKPVKLFRARGLRVLLPLLCLDDAVNAPFRQIAEWAGVALGTVANAMDDLERLGYLHKTRKGRVLEQRADLIRRWVEAYPQELRPRLKPQRFEVADDNWWKKFGRRRFEQYRLWLGGEGAEALLTKYLHPELITVYGHPDFKELAKELHPARKQDGNLEWLEPFWNFEIPDFDPACRLHRFCPPLLIYADLLAAGDARHLEAADMIRTKYIDHAAVNG